jgi:hypothetical protein
MAGQVKVRMSGISDRAGKPRRFNLEKRPLKSEKLRLKKDQKDAKDLKDTAMQERGLQH